MTNPKYPANEIVWVSYFDKTGNLLFIMTSKPTRDQYMLYELKNGKFVRLGKAKSPDTLEEQFKIDELLK